MLSSTTEGKTTLYLYGDGLLAQENEADGYLYYHFNNIGSTTVVTDKDGEIVYAFTYGTYGELLSGDTHGIMFLYNGRYGVVTDDNGLYYMRARYYNVDIKRFINQDVIEGNITNSPSLNKYAYCQGNPVSQLDPFGLSPQSQSSMMGHFALDILGFVPGLGIIADIANGIWYWNEGDYFGAIASFIAAVPMLGDFIGGSAKFASKFPCLANKIIFGGRAIGAAGGFGLSLGQIYKASSDLANKHILNHQAWDDDSTKMLSQGLFAVGTGLLSSVSFGDNLNGFANSQCFVAGTLILTVDGNKPIEEIKAGDFVYSTNPETGESEYKEVVRSQYRN